MRRSIWTAEQVLALGVRTDLVTAGSVLGLGRTAAHQLARAGAFPIPVLRLGARYVVPTAPLLALLGIAPERSEAEPSTGPAIATSDLSGGPRHGERTHALRPVADA